MEIHMTVSLAHEAGYLKEKLQSNPATFPQVALHILREKYDAHISYLRNQIRTHAVEADTVKDLRDLLDDIIERRNDLDEIIKLHLASVNGVPKTQERLAQERIKASSLYAVFVRKYPLG